MFRLDEKHVAQDVPYVAQWITYRPELAQAILDGRNTNNRQPKPKKIRKMAAAMALGHFLVTHQGVAFSESGILLDGQNRLLACVASKTPIVLLTVFGLPDRAQSEMDRGTSRTDYESLRFGYGKQLDREIVATAKAMIGFGVSAERDTAALNEFIETHIFALEACFEVFPARTDGVTAAIRGCVARAYYTAKLEDLVLFGKIAMGAPFQEGQTAASNFGRVVLSSEHTTLRARAPGFAFTQRGLLYFLSGLDLTPQGFKPLYGNFFPLPGETATPIDEWPPVLRNLRRGR